MMNTPPRAEPSTRTSAPIPPAPPPLLTTLFFALGLLALATAWAAGLALAAQMNAPHDPLRAGLFALSASVVYAVSVYAFHYRKLAAMPLLLTAGGVLYLLGALAEAVHAWTPLQAPLATILASGVALVPGLLALSLGFTQWLVRIMRALRRQARFTRRLGILQTMLRTLDVHRPPADGAHQVLTFALQALRAEGGTVLLVDHTTHELEFVAVIGSHSESLIGMRLPPGTGLAGWAVHQGRAVRVNNAQADSRFYAGVDRLTGETTRALLAAPIMTGETIVGVIEVINRTSSAGAPPEDFTDDDLAFMELFSQAAALVVQPLRLTADGAHPAGARPAVSGVSDAPSATTS